MSNRLQRVFRQNAGCHVRKFVEQRLDQFRPAERFVVFDGKMELVAARSEITQHRFEIPEIGEMPARETGSSSAVQAWPSPLSRTAT